jgi:hypothetical protein
MLICVLLIRGSRQKDTRFGNKVKNFNIDINNLQNSLEIGYKTY